MKKIIEANGLTITTVRYHIVLEPCGVVVLGEVVVVLSAQNKKDQCCIWMLSDLIIISSVKRKSGPVTRKATVIL